MHLTGGKYSPCILQLLKQNKILYFLHGGFLAYAVHHHSEISYYDGTKKMLMTDKENLKLNKVGAANDTDQAPMKVIGQGHCLVLLKRWPHSPVPKFIVVCPVGKFVCLM